MTPITDQAGFDKLATLPTALLLKHGAHCPISANARDELGSFEKANPACPVYALEVTEHRALSKTVAESLGVEHESPQLFLLENGKATWHRAHYDINEQEIAGRLAGR